jgi:hypothetical protein
MGGCLFVFFPINTFLCPRKNVLIGKYFKKTVYDYSHPYSQKTRIVLMTSLRKAACILDKYAQCSMHTWHKYKIPTRLWISDFIFEDKVILLLNRTVSIVRICNLCWIERFQSYEYAIFNDLEIQWMIFIGQDNAYNIEEKIIQWSARGYTMKKNPNRPVENNARPK